MAKRKKRKTKKRQNIKRNVQFEIGGLVLFALSLISFWDSGAIGRGLIYLYRFLIGEWFFAIPIFLIALSITLIWKRSWPNFFTQRLIGMYMIFTSILLLSHVTLFELLAREGPFEKPSVIINTWELFWMDVHTPNEGVDLGGGMIGALLFAIFHLLFAVKGAKLFGYVILIVGIMLLTGKSFTDLISQIFHSITSFFKNTTDQLKKDVKKWRNKGKKNKTKKKSNEKGEEGKVVFPTGDLNENESSEPIISNFAEKVYKEEKPELKSTEFEEEEEEDRQSVTVHFPEEIENADYQLPPLSLLNPPKQADQSSEYDLIHANAAKLERTFQSFGVKARVTQVHIGPAVTKYEVHPDVGVKVSKIVNLTDDIALALAAKDIRIEAPIPGKSAIGIEVPNSEIAVVSLREVLEEAVDKEDSKLLIGLGRDITGEAVFAELNRMPHLLVAGATGSGKSVCINGIITSILMRAKPHEVKMMMIDPKMVELNVYNGVPHLLAPVVTNPKKASQALKKIVNEMERRYERFSETGTRNIEGYNDFIRRKNEENNENQPLLPYIVVIVDELADLMMVASSDVEEAITRLAQMARAAGIHLIIATQRPSVDVITGVIKANIPSRIAFAVSSQTDSRTILDTGGAEKLLGRGDMLFLPVGASKPIRIQGAFLSDEEVEHVVDFVISQQKAQYEEEMIPDGEADDEFDVEDDLYPQAVRLISEMQTASVSLLQRRFRIGYTRAARLIDEMEKRGVVGPYEGSKPRTVLIPKPDDEEIRSS
ncbi:FtsK/SpoIIIE family DNA translocase [Fervidibacillus halotolerans]|uniref:DNA translocase FtsK n=1 Tax=Fervidibacillus halotolerans TaxID=2980027 RepID=A0A9E8M1J7_9BACI|nr:DNA translocase FtsK [Fervidibacillus halotolerans]WAA13549.1 DNA translocase FtsK [Fervidibacillus halotolerans]